ncbi:hypothetical protein C0995_009874 [Termitomyces sp. Mi166|nr:hypothetical protein C0995_009874 [Termitomyces sp. Mi166\
MAKGVVAEPSVNAVRFNRSGSSKLAPASSALSSRASMLASVVPMLRKQADVVQKTPLLTLKLSSPSFLDTTVTDDVTEQPLYTIKTVGPTTTIKRADPWDGDTKTAEIRWSRTIPQKGKNASDGVLIQMRGIRWKGSETFLRRGSGRKFNIPNYAQSLKWKRQGNVYWCTTAAVKGPIAILALVDDLSTPQFQIFETLHDKNDTRPMLVHHGVSTLLLDYLLVTALFLVTDSQEWTQYQVADITIPTGDVTDLTGLATPKSVPGNFSTSNKQWRKIMYGEPIYPNLSSDSPQSSPSSSVEALTPTPLSPEQLAKVKYGQPIYQTRQSYSPAPSTSESEHVYFSPPTTRSQSPASESIFSPVSRGAAPSHTYLDPSYYHDDENVPPVPSIPAHLSINVQANHSPVLRPSSSHSTASTTTRRLPDIPVLPPVPPLIPRPRSTPPRPRTSPFITTEAVRDHAVPIPGPSTTPRPPRQLPQPPQTLAISSHPDDRQPPAVRVRTRTRSASQSHAIHEREKWQPHAAYHQRTLPTPPTSSSQGGVRGTPLRLQRVVSESGRFIINKEVDDGLVEHWDGDAEPAATYDMPPPAYSSINFSPRVSDSPLQGRASVMS